MSKKKPKKRKKKRNLRKKSGKKNGRLCRSMRYNWAGAQRIMRREGGDKLGEEEASQEAGKEEREEGVLAAPRALCETRG